MRREASRHRVDAATVTQSCLQLGNGSRQCSRRAAAGGGHWVEVPFDAKQVFGEARPPVQGTVNGTRFRSAARRLRRHHLPRSDQRGTDRGGDRSGFVGHGGLGAGRHAAAEVDVPEALAPRLGRDKSAKAAFDKLAFTHRKEYAQWIAEAKRDDTRASGASRRPSRCCATASRTLDYGSLSASRDTRLTAVRS